MSSRRKHTFVRFGFAPGVEEEGGGGGEGYGHHWDACSLRCRPQFLFSADDVCFGAL